MPRGVSNVTKEDTRFFLVLIIALAIIWLVLGLFLTGLNFISPPFIFIWDFLQSIWYWLPYAIVGILITPVLVFTSVYMNDLLDGCILTIIFSLVLAVVGFVAITLIGLIWSITVTIENESKEVQPATPVEAIAP